ncbi:MAG: hypothetical protein NVS9B4_20170 [Candidatus Acidiferrum sp.]
MSLLVGRGSNRVNALVTPDLRAAQPSGILGFCAAKVFFLAPPSPIQMAAP